ncbi:GNAT family N-acetyltransferase [Azotosporobacter soli]|uniref:GNAT family N-acetyltransferase n=1 Tax=Azotosporobacter soli TaxID=3055040 RepID=UPI0031FEB217
MKIERLRTPKAKWLPRLLELEREAFGDGALNEWNLVPMIRHGCVHVALQDDEIVGLVEYMRDWEKPERAYMVGVSVAQALRGQGLGSALLRASLSELKQSGVTEVELTVDPSNQAAIRVYREKLGFVEQEMRRGEYGSAEDRLVMTVIL